MFNSKLPILRFWKYISKKRKIQLISSVFITIISGFSELITITAALPFLAVISSPQTISNYKITIFISKLLNLPLNEELYSPIILFFSFAVILSTIFRLLNIWISLKLATLIGNDLNIKSFSNVISQDYKYHINTNSSKIITANTNYINSTVAAIIQALNLFSNLILSILLSIGIIIINPKLSLISILMLSIIYFIIGKKFNKRLSNYSKRVALASNSKVKLTQEVLGSIRSVLLESNEQIYINQSDYFDKIIRVNQAKILFISEFPRYVIEAIVLISISLISLIVLTNEINNTNSILVLLGGFTIGLQRLLPNIQRVYSSWANLQGFNAAMRNILELLELKAKKKTSIKKELIFNKSIKLDSIYFAYKKGNENNISNFNLEIFKGQKIGIIGETGSGKSTIADLIMGLLKPSHGKIYVDGKDIHDNAHPERINRWMSSISHVPQNIFLIDGSFKENIAFGLKNNLVPLKKVKEAAKKAQIHEFIESTENGYSTFIGERGIKLSGGQIQRIGIARALYRKSKILIFDEATSALDNKTEFSLMKCINEISKDITIISIAHRHSTLKDFDKIIKIKKGAIDSVLDPKDIL